MLKSEVSFIQICIENQLQEKIHQNINHHFYESGLLMTLIFISRRLFLPDNGGQKKNKCGHILFMVTSLHSFLQLKLHMCFIPFLFLLSACIPCQTASVHNKKKAVVYIILYRFYIPFIFYSTLTISRGGRIQVLIDFLDFSVININLLVFQCSQQELLKGIVLLDYLALGES